MKFGDQKMSAEKTAGIMDTGTSLIYAPQVVVTKMVQAIGATFVPQVGLYMVDCGSTLPDLEFTIGGNKITVPGSDLVLKDDDGRYCFFTVSTMNFGAADTSDVATLNVELGDEIIQQMNNFVGESALPIPAGYDAWLIGDTFLRKVYTIYDFGNKKFGYAKLK